MDKGKRKVKNGAADIIKYSVISGFAGGICAAIVSVIASLLLENTDAPELYFDGVSWSSVIAGSLFGGVLNGLLEKGRAKYSGAAAGAFAALTMLIFSALSGGLTDGTYEPLKAVFCITASFLGGCTVSFGNLSSRQKGWKKAKFARAGGYHLGR